MEENNNDLFQGLPDLDLNSSSENIPFTLLPNRSSSCPVDKEVIYPPNMEEFSFVNPAIDGNYLPQMSLERFNHNLHSMESSIFYCKCSSLTSHFAVKNQSIVNTSTSSSSSIISNDQPLLHCNSCGFKTQTHLGSSAMTRCFFPSNTFGSENQVSEVGSTTTRCSSSCYACNMKNQDASMIYQLVLESPFGSNYTFALEKKLGLHNLIETETKQGQVIEECVYKRNTCYEEFPNSRAFGGHMSSDSKMKKVEDDKAPECHSKRIKYDPVAQVSLPLKSNLFPNFTKGNLTKTPDVSTMNSSGVGVENENIIQKFEEESIKEEPAKEGEDISPPIYLKSKKEKDVQ